MMMWFFLPLTVLFVLAGTGSVALDRRLQRRKQQARGIPATESVKRAFTDYTASGRSRIERWRNKFIRRQATDLPMRFRTWTTSAPGGNAAVREWIPSLSDQGLQAFTNQLAGYCSDMGFELEWVVGQQLDKFPELAQTLSQVVWSYCQACQHVVEAQDDLEAYTQLQAFESNPTSSNSQAFGKKVFARVVDADLTSVTMSQYLTASPTQQAQFIVQAVHETAAKDQEAFKRILKETIRGSAAAPQPAAPQPAAPSATPTGS